MIFLPLLRYAFLFAPPATAQSSSSSRPISVSQITLTGASEAATPTGSYLSYSSTLILAPTPSPISTSPVLSTITSGSTTRITTLGSTTILGIGTRILGNSSTTSAVSSSQIILQGSSRSSSSSSLNSNSTTNSTSTSTSTSAQPTNTTPCNNYPEFCSRSYGNITEVAAHNSPFFKAGNAASNQALPVLTQLNDGIRFLQGQVHFVNSTPHFCHTSCSILDAGPITTYLSTVATWVSTHPYDVLTILLGNGDYKDVTTYIPFIESSGLLPYLYTPPKIPMGINDWPPLSSMILTGKRVVLFMDYSANQTAVPYILDEFTQLWETPFDPTDPSFPCTVQRPPNLAEKDAKGRMYMINHNLNYEIKLLGNSLLVPNIPLLNITNNVTGNGSLGLNVQQCNSTWGFPPKFLNVDYYNVGNGSVFEVAARWNGVKYTRKCCGVVSAGGKMKAWGGGLAMWILVGGVWFAVGLVQGY